MKFAYNSVSRVLEDALGIPAFNVEINGEIHGVIIVKKQLDEFLEMLLKHENVDLRTDKESASAVAQLSDLVSGSIEDIATRVRDQAQAADLQGHSFIGCNSCGTKNHGSIATPFGTHEVGSFANALYVTSAACKSGLPAHIGIGILQQALAFGLQLNDPPTGRGAGMRTGIFVTTLRG